MVIRASVRAANGLGAGRDATTHFGTKCQVVVTFERAVDEVLVAGNMDSHPLRVALPRLPLRAAAAQIPEPATLALLGIGLAGLGFSRRKRIAI